MSAILRVVQLSSRTLTLLVACSVLAGCRGGGRDETSPRPAFAVAGAVETDYNIHIYRATLPPSGGRGLVIQFHPRSATFRLQDDTPLAVDGLVVCEYAVGFGSDVSRLPGSCRTVTAGGHFEVGGEGAEHVAVELLAPGDDEVFIPEFVVEYDPADAFLAIEFPAR